VKTLVIQTAFLGDLIMTLPLIRRLRDEQPDSPITLAVRPSLAEFAADQYGVSDVLSLKKRRGWLERLGHDRGTLRGLRAPGFDTVYLAHRSFRSGLYARLSGAHRRVGFRGTPASWACTERVEREDSVHETQRYLTLAGPLPDYGGDPRPQVLVRDDVRRERDALFASVGIDPGKPFVTLMPGSVWPTKRWTVEGFAGVAHRFAARGTTVVLDGAPEERALCEQVRESAGGLPINIAGKTPLPLMAAALEASRLLIGNDSGPAHVAAAVGTPVVAIYGPTTPATGLQPTGCAPVWSLGLDELECRPCGRHGARQCPLGHHRCMRSLDAETVIDSIERLCLRSTSPGTPPVLLE